MEPGSFFMPGGRAIRQAALGRAGSANVCSWRRMKPENPALVMPRTLYRLWRLLAERIVASLSTCGNDSTILLCET
jgi:hypothetical protein